MNNKGADQSARMRMLVYTIAVRKTPEDRFSRSVAQIKMTKTTSLLKPFGSVLHDQSIIWKD